jgi:hypothetical protein
MRASVLSGLFAALLTVPLAAHAEDWIFFDGHPIHPAVGGGFCDTAGAHVHDYAPVDPSAFVVRDGLWYFVGDPVTYGYRGTVYRYDGAHEVAHSTGIATCSRSGAHYHLYAPAVVVGPDTGLYVTPVVVDPYWWDRRVRRRAEPRRPHAFPVEVNVARPAPPAIGPGASRHVAPRPVDPPVPRTPMPPPPARAARRGR